MYYWSIEALKSDMVAGKYTESQKFKYFYIYCFFGVFFLLIESLLDVSLIGTTVEAFDAYLDFGMELVYYTLMAIAIYVAYLKNGGAQGSQFVSRFMGLSIVLGVRFFVFAIVPVLVLFGLGVMFAVVFHFMDLSFKDGLIDIVVHAFIFVICLVYYIRLCCHFLDIREAEKKIVTV